MKRTILPTMQSSNILAAVELEAVRQEKSKGVAELVPAMVDQASPRLCASLFTLMPRRSFCAEFPAVINRRDDKFLEHKECLPGSDQADLASSCQVL